MNDEASSKPYYIQFPKNTELKQTHTSFSTHGAASTQPQECSTYSFMNLMYGRETDATRDYRYSCFRSQSDQLENDINELLEITHSDIINSLRAFIEQKETLVDTNKVLTAVLLLGTSFSDHYRLYARIIALFKDSIYGPIISLHAKQAIDMKTCFKQIIDVCLQFGQQQEKKIRSTETNQGKKRSNSYCEYDPQYLIQWYEDAISSGLIDQNLFKMIIFLQEVEGFQGNFINHFITVLKKIHKQIPLLLFISVSTSIQMFQDILEKKSIKALNVQYFNTNHPKDNLDIAIEKILVTSKQSKIRLGPHLYYTLLGIYQKHSFNIESFISAIKYIIMCHFYSNPISIVNHCDSIHSELISHDHLECLRSLPSMKQYVETLIDSGDIYSAESLLNDDHYFRNIIDTLINNMNEHNKKLDASLSFLNIIQKKYVSSTRKKTFAWIYGKLLDGNLNKNLDIILDPIKTMNTIDILQFIHEALSFKNIHDQFLDLENFYKKITNVINSFTYKASEHNIPNRTNSSEFTETSDKIKSETYLSAIEPELYDIRKSLNQYLRELLANYLKSPMTFPLHELYYFNYSRTYLDVFHPRLRATVDTALSLPSHYLSCDYETKNEKNSSIAFSYQPKICICYKLFLESGSLINISDWLTAFIQSATCNNDNENDKQKSERYLQASFLQSLEELRYLGFIKPTKRRKDHVTKITWMR